MPRNASGIYTLPASNPVIPFTVITSTWANDTMSDIAAALTGSIAANGTTVVSANLPMGGLKHTGVGAATQFNQYARADQVQFNEFNAVNGVTYSTGTYSGTMSFSVGNTVALVDKMPAIFTPPVTNAILPKLAINGGTAYQILNPDGTTIAANKFVPNYPISLVWNQAALAWVMVGSTGASILTIDSADPAVLAVTYPVPGAALLTPQSNIASGGVKLTPATKIPVALMPADALTMLGLWNASGGTNPANGTVQGQYYIVSTAGTLNLFRTTGTGTTYTSQSTAVTSGDMLLWVQTGVTGQPQGWYYVAKGGVSNAGSVTSTPTPYAPAATTVQAWMDKIDSNTGLAALDGVRQFSAINTTSTGFIQTPTYAQNLYFSGGWKFKYATGMGSVLVQATAPWASTYYVTNAASTGADSAATIVDVAWWGFGSSYVKVPWGIQGPPRAPTGQQYHLDVYNTGGSQRFVLQDVTNQVGFKVVAASTGVFLDCARMDATGAGAALGGVPYVFRSTDTGGAVFTGMSIGTSRQIQIGDGAGGTSQGSICSTQNSTSLGVFSGALSFLALQTIMLAVGSTVTGITMTRGQIARFMVIGNGTVTLPASVKLPRGGAVWGLTFTIIGLYFDGTNIYASFTPYD